MIRTVFAYNKICPSLDQQIPEKTLIADLNYKKAIDAECSKVLIKNIA